MGLLGTCLGLWWLFLLVDEGIRLWKEPATSRNIRPEMKLVLLQRVITSWKFAINFHVKYNLAKWKSPAKKAQILYLIITRRKQNSGDHSTCMLARSVVRVLSKEANFRYATNFKIC